LSCFDGLYVFGIALPTVNVILIVLLVFQKGTVTVMGDRFVHGPSPHCCVHILPSWLQF